MVRSMRCRRCVLVPLACLVITVAVAPRAEAEERAGLEAVALAVHGMAAFGAGQYGDAFAVFREAAAVYPRDPLLHTGAGLAATMLGRQREAVEWFEQALRLDADQVEASRVLGELYYRGGRAREAIGVYERALSRRPAAPLRTRLDAWRRETRVLARFTERRATHFSIWFERPEDEAVALTSLRLLESAYQRLGAAMRVYPSTRVTVVLYTPAQFHALTSLPAWTAGAFDGRIRLPMPAPHVPLTEQSRVLAHELVHAMVATLAGPSVPTWLDEGLASVLASDPAEGDAAPEEADVALPAGGVPLAMLRQRFSHLTEATASLAYAQSTRAVRRLIARRGTEAVVALLHDVGDGQLFEEAFARRFDIALAEFSAALGR
jgi:tetratricopeptide (TPR) repeat protein